MDHSVLWGLTTVLVLGISAQWMAMRLKMPSIFFLLVFGFIAGPITGLIHPPSLLGPLFFPLISLSVAVILFEGGMDLKLSELKNAGRAIRNLVTVGAGLTWILATLAARFAAGLTWSLSILLGAILVVTGPTVIVPLLHHVRPSGRVRSVLKWEGLMNDPIGAVLAVLVFESLLAGSWTSAGQLVVGGVLKTLVLAGGIGYGMALILVFFLRRYWIPDSLHQVVTLMFVIVGFVLANALQGESGLLTVTLMGIVMANQKKVPIKHIVEFKENLRTLILAFLFILLAATLDMESLRLLDWRSGVFCLLLIGVVRPVSVFLSCRGSDLTFREKVFVSWMAPRGIVAAAVSSIFGYELIHAGLPQAERLVPLTFLVIMVTVSVYGLSCAWVARLLGLAESNPQGVLMVGAHTWGRRIARLLQDLGYKVVLIDSNAHNVTLAHQEGLPAVWGDALSEDVADRLNLQGIGKFFAWTANDEANALAVMHWVEIFGRAQTYQVSPESVSESADDPVVTQWRGRILFHQGMDYFHISRLFEQGARLKVVEISEGVNADELLRAPEGERIPLFFITPSQELIPFAVDEPPSLVPGGKLIVCEYGRSVPQREDE